MLSELLGPVSTYKSSLRKLGILLILMSCPAVLSANTQSQLLGLMHTEEPFNFLDQDASGTVSRDEYVEPFLKEAEFWLRIKASMESGRHIFDHYQGYKNGNNKKRFALTRFWRWDFNRDDLLSPEEFNNFLVSEDSESETNQEDIFPEIDQDRDGTLSYEEFEKETDRQYALRFSSKTNQVTDSPFDEGVDEDVVLSKLEAIKISSRDLAQEKKRIEKQFESTDMNGDFVLTVDEFMSWQRYSEIHSELKDVSFETMDTDNDDSISLNEFHTEMKTRLHERVAANEKIESETERREAHSAMEQRLIKSFKNLDSNDDGYVTQTEMDEYQNLVIVTPLTLR